MSTADLDIVVPDIGGAGEVDVIEILVKPGDKVNIDTPLITLESDKATMEVPSTAAGVVRHLKVRVGDKIAQGAAILTLEHTADRAATAKIPEKTIEKEIAAPVVVAAPVVTSDVTPVVAPVVTPDVAPVGSGDVHAGPAVRKLARELGVNLAEVTATGPKTRLLKEDIENYVKAKLALVANGSVGAGLPVAPVIDFAKFGEVAVTPLTRIKKISGKNLHRNWILVPHITQMGEADITEMEAFRQNEKAALEKQGVKLTPLVFIIKAVVAALKHFPQFNASLDAGGDHLVLKKYFHIGVAVDTPDGLVVPVIRDADQKGLATLAKELAVLSDKARKKQLLPGDMQGGCFSISSLGGIGGTAFTPIVNMPEVAILGVSKSSFKPVYENGTFVPRLMLPLSLSYDHRVIDGADGARFMVYLTEKLSDIRKLLI